MREAVDLRLTPPGRQRRKISLIACNFVTLACKTGSALKHTKIKIPEFF